MRKILKNRRGKNLLFRTKQSLQCTMYCTSTYVLKVCSMLKFLKVLRRTEGLFTEQINKFYVHRNDRENNYLILAVTKLRIMLTKTRSFTSLINLKFSKNLQYRYVVQYHNIYHKSIYLHRYSICTSTYIVHP